MASSDRIQGISGDLAIKAPVRAATTAPITLAGLQTVDDVILAADDRVLVKDQADSTENGIYNVSTGSWQRAKDFDGAYDSVAGTLITVNEGTVAADTIWKVDADGTPGSDALTFSLSAANIAVQLASPASGLGASLVAIEDAGGHFAGGTVEAALQELGAEDDALAASIANHLADAVDAHDASAISVAATGNLAATEVQAALQELQGDIDVVNGAETDIASAATTAIGGVASQNVRITGTTTITSFGTVAAGIRRNVRMADALILTHNATSLILPGGANITTAAGDTFEALSLGSGNWFVAAYQRASGASPVSTSIRIEKFTSNGTFTPPAGVTTVWVTAQGGGGGGGGTGGAPIVGGGGGAAGVGTIRQQVSVTPGTPYAVTIGGGGAGGSNIAGNGNGSTGGTTSLGALVSLSGGTLGYGGSSTAAIPGGGGASAGAYSSAGHSSMNTFLGANGGPGLFGGSGLGGSGAGVSGGAGPSNSGGGGGGAAYISSLNASGGDGGSGFLIIEY